MLLSTPAFDSIIKVFRASKPVLTNPGTKPPAVVLVFQSTLHRLVIFRFKKGHLPKPNPVERSVGARKFIVVEDLTKANFAVLKQLQSSDLVAKVWSSEGRIKFVLASDSNTVHTVTRVYEPIEKIIHGTWTYGPSFTGIICFWTELYRQSLGLIINM